MLEKLKNKMDLLVKKSNRILVSENIRNDRLITCSSCVYRIESVNLCSKCGCYLPAKTKLAGSACPIGKWQAVVLDDKE